MSSPLIQEREVDIKLLYSTIHFIDVLIIAPASHRAELSDLISQPDASYTSLSALKITLESIDDAESATLGTADILRKFASSFQVRGWAISGSCRKMTRHC